MSKDELKALLGEGDAASGLGSAVEAEASSTVLKTDRWTRRTGERLAAEWAEAGVDGVTPESVDLAADAVETLLATTPKLHERPADAKRARWWKSLLDNPATAALRSRTMLNPAVAELAAASLATQYASFAEATAEREEKPDEEESPRESMERARSIRKALDEASETADDAEHVGAGLGISGDSSVGAREIAQYTRRLRKSPRLAKIMQMAGRFTAKAQQLQRQRTNLPGMEITGVELSGDMARVLPIEAALVAGAVPELELLAMARLAQRRAMSYRKITRAPVGMGPIVVSVDESGSMYGAKVEAAKGLALAMAAIARAQKRPFMLAAYTNDKTIRIADGSPDSIVDWCEAFLSGGSSLDMPLSSIRPHWPTGAAGKLADHIIIGDAEITAASDEYLNSYADWAKTNKIRTYSIIIGQHKPGALGAVSDGGCWCLPSLDLDNPAIDAILSLGPTMAVVK